MSFSKRILLAMAAVALMISFNTGMANAAAMNADFWVVVDQGATGTPFGDIANGSIFSGSLTWDDTNPLYDAVDPFFRNTTTGSGWTSLNAPLGSVSFTFGNTTFTQDDDVTFSFGVDNEAPLAFVNNGVVTDLFYSIGLFDQVDLGFTTILGNPTGFGTNFGVTGALTFTDPNTSAVPVPGAVWLLGAGITGLLGLRRTRK